MKKTCCLDSQSLRFALLGLIFLFSHSHCVPLQGSSSGNPVKRDTGCVPPPRDACKRSILGPHFYDECIEATFPSLEDGFVLSYAAKRWDMIAYNLSHIGSKLQDYLHLSEKCFQIALETEAKAMAQRFVPNAETRLQFETKAISLMNECYRKQNVCVVLDPELNKDHHAVQDDLHSVVDAFRLGGHYFNNTMVDMGIPEAVRGCDGQEELADSLTHTKLPVKVTLCALTRIFPNPNSDSEPAEKPEDERVSELVEKLSEILNRSSEQFMYAGEDESGICSSINDEYEIIVWFADPTDPLLQEPLGDNGVLKPHRSASVYIQFSDSLDMRREASQCGDGIRQVGEMCDFGGNNLMGCDLTCNVRYEYQCTTERLAASECAAGKPHHQAPVLCEPTRRQRQPLPAARAQMPSLPVLNSVESEPINSEQLGTSSAADMLRTSNLSLILIAIFSLWISRR